MCCRMTLVTVVLALVSQAAMANQICAGREDLPERVLHFPKGQSVGQVHVIDGRHTLPQISREFHPGYVFAPVQYLAPAQGDVTVPAGKRATLHLGGSGVTRQQCFDCLEALNPGDIQGLDFTQSLQADDAFLPYMARLTGLSGVCPVYARFSGKGWMTLRTLTGLEHICTPYGLTDDEMAGIVALQTVNEMEIVATKLTDAGLASIARLRNLEVLHLDGTAMMTDDGLKALATLPRLRHLRLTGPFTDRGIRHLAVAAFAEGALAGEPERFGGGAGAPCPMQVAGAAVRALAGSDHRPRHDASEVDAQTQGSRRRRCLEPGCRRGDVGLSIEPRSARPQRRSRFDGQRLDALGRHAQAPGPANLQQPDHGSGLGESGPVQNAGLD